ncbi:hypothetical protein PVK06_041434 [Gossypium arboreum]|uniref:Uncharacterized protein n=1 Tax=Gossypium arboreum TaxID=29729 RepID=A0ABR0N887_GOSAR|nr:hypothetical protein PVK06_041434 [Gossypium arboreum]
METRGRARKASRSRDILSSLENRVVNLEESVGGINETLEIVVDRIKDLSLIREDFKDFVWETLRSTSDKLTVRYDALEVIVTAMKEVIVELNEKLTIEKAALGRFIIGSFPFVRNLPD